jgi:phage gp29-like protein
MRAKGLYISPTEFVSFADGDRASGNLSDHIATRDRSPDFRALGMLLPNPDPVLKKQGKDISVYADLRSDAAVGGAIRRRKSGVVMMEWRVERDKASARMAKLVESVLGELDMRRVLREMLDAPLFGWQTMEVIWTPPQTGGPVVPVDVLAKPLTWFHFDPDGGLRFKSKDQPLFGELVPERKFLVPAQDATYANPYGFADLSMVFWPTVFKRGGLKFWVTFTEKFGMPWLVGKTPRGTPNSEQDKLLDQLEAMAQDAVAVIPDDASIDTLKADGKTGSADLYERLLMFCRSEIAIALLGQNQTTEKDSTHASATAGAGVSDDLRDADARLCEAALNQLARWIVDLNEGEGAPAPKVGLYEQEEVDKAQAERDEILTKAGARLTKSYFMRTYDLDEGDIDDTPATPPGGLQPGANPAQPGVKGAVPTPAQMVAFAESVARGADPLAAQSDVLAQAGNKVVGDMVAKIQALVDQASSMPELQQAMLDAYGNLGGDELTKVMAAAFALAELKGMDAAAGA